MFPSVFAARLDVLFPIVDWSVEEEDVCLRFNPCPILDSNGWLLLGRLKFLALGLTSLYFFENEPLVGVIM